jgi:hypothetical protein
VREFADRLDWFGVSVCQILSEAFMADCANKIRWDAVCVFQVLSEEFIAAHSEQVNWPNICCRQLIGESFMDTWAAKLNWEEILWFHTLTPRFLAAHAGHISWTEIGTWLCFDNQDIEAFRPWLTWDREPELVTNLGYGPVTRRQLRVYIHHEDGSVSLVHDGVDLSGPIYGSTQFSPI